VTIPKHILNAIFRAIRNEFKKSDTYKQCILDNSIPSGPRGGLRTQCDICKEYFLPKQIEVDHLEDELGVVVPYGKKYYEVDIETYYRRVFFDLKIRCLCKEHHKQVTAAQNLKRKQYK